MVILRTRLRSLMAFGGLLLALGLAFFILPGPGTSYAQPTLSVTSLSIGYEPKGYDAGACIPEATLEWGGTKFSKRDGFIKFELFVFDADTANDEPLAWRNVRINAGDTGGARFFTLGKSVTTDPNTSYLWKVEFYQANGRNGPTGKDRIGRFLLSKDSESLACSQ